MFVDIGKHAIEKCISRCPHIVKWPIKYMESDAKLYIENKLRELLSERNRNLNDWRVSQKYFNKVYTITDWVEKIVYAKIDIWEVFVITYAYKAEIDKLELRLLKEFKIPIIKKWRYYK